ncbi:MAG TPA: hypothetical protein VM262_03655 [Acidimicrobiales bacterium]|nr:hypothetical protein [Acidimicrobiales bacterium]
MQLFVGVWPPPLVQRALAAYPRGDLDGWSTPGEWLINVRPLGRVEPAVVTELLDVLSFELDGMPAPRAALQTPRHGEWLRVEVAGLDELRDVVFEATTPIVPVTHPKSLPWAPVLPLRKDRSPKELVHPLTGSWSVEEVVLAEGTRRGGAYHYETVATVPLGG